MSEVNASGTYRRTNAERIAIVLVMVLLPVGLKVLFGQVQERQTRLRIQKERERALYVAKKNSQIEKRAVETATRHTEGESVGFFESIRRRATQVFSVGASGGDVPASLPGDFTMEELKKQYRQAMIQRGVRDDEFIQMNMLEQLDREYIDAFTKATTALDDRQLDTARELLRAALQALSPQHLIAREKLLELLHKIEIAATNYEAARRIKAELGQVHQQMATITSRAMVEAGAISAGQAQENVELVKKSDALQEEMQELANVFTPEGEDPSKAHERGKLMIDTLIAAYAKEHGMGMVADELKPRDSEAGNTK